MASWTGSTAFVTGGASGIGRALALALARRGVHVCVADLDAAGAERVASECGDRATSVALDVCDAQAVREAIVAFARRTGRLDYVFNNAGIGAAGETEEIPLAAWHRVVDVNVFGVLHGVLAAYPILLQQGSGHIVNTASMAGLGPAPLLTPYALTKHAVVGLSRSLRIEAAPRGVRVSALCPSVIETPILRPRNPAEAGIPWIPDVRRFLTRVAGPPYPVEKCAEETLEAVQRNEELIVLPARARLAWRLGRFFPDATASFLAPAVAAERRSRTAPPHPESLEGAVSRRDA